MRVNTVNKAQKSPGTCGKCGKVIKAKEAYRWAKGRYTGKKLRCSAAGCQFRPSDLTGSDKLSTLYAAREAVEDVLTGDFDAAEIRDALETCAEEARNVGQEYQESCDNLDGKLNAEELQEKADQCEQWADEVAGVDVEEFDETKTDPATLSAEGASDAEDALEERREEWREEVRSQVQDALDSLEL